MHLDGSSVAASILTYFRSRTKDNIKKKDWETKTC